MPGHERDASLEGALKDVESIQSLDTARLALRWALERMRALERRVESVESDARTLENAKSRALEEVDSARQLLSRRTAEALERERYYSKIEEYLNLKLGGEIDPAALARREAALEGRENVLQTREIETERELKASKARYEEEFKNSLEEATASFEARRQDLSTEFERRITAREREYSSRVLEQHERQAQIEAMEKSLEERRKRFEEFHRAQRTTLSREASAIGEAAADHAEFLERRVEQALSLRTAAIEKAAENDRKALLDEIATWRAKAREHLPELFEAERKAAESQDAYRRLSDHLAVIDKAKAELAAEMSQWRAQAQSQATDRIAAQGAATLAMQRIDALEAALSREREKAQTAIAELQAAQVDKERVLAEIVKIESACAAKMRDAEDNIFRQYDVWLEREESLRMRDSSWRIQSEARRQAIDAMRAQIIAQREELSRAIAEYAGRLKQDAEQKQLGKSQEENQDERQP